MQEPFGVICDLRVYDRAITNKKQDLDFIACYADDTIEGMPDWISEHFKNENGIILLINSLQDFTNNETVFWCLKCLALLSTKRSIKIEIIKN